MSNTSTFLLGLFLGAILGIFLVGMVTSPTQAAAFEVIGSDDFGTIYEGRYHKDMKLPCSPGDLHFGTFMKSVWKCETGWRMYSDTPGEDWRRYWAAKKGKE
jgi:hypothetical protein